MKQIEPCDLADVRGGLSYNYDPAACGMVTSGGALLGGLAGQMVGKRYGLSNIGWLAGAATGGGLSHHFSIACH